MDDIKDYEKDKIVHPDRYTLEMLVDDAMEICLSFFVADLSLEGCSGLKRPRQLLI